MAGLAKAAVSLRDYPSGLNVVTFDIDPSDYQPYQAAVRGSSMKVLDGTVVHQFFGLKQPDFVINVTGFFTEADTVQSMWTKYRQGAGGVQFEWRDWVENRFVVVFTPGVESFKPAPVIGALNAHAYSLNLSVISILQFFNAAY